MIYMVCTKIMYNMTKILKQSFDFSAKMIHTFDMEKLASTREHLLLVARQLFAERGFDGLSIRKLAETAGVNLGAVNYHFKTKEDLYLSVFRDRLAGVHDIFSIFEKEASAPPAQVVPKFIEHFVTYVLVKNPQMVPMMLRELSTPQSPRLDMIAHEFLEPNMKLLLGYLQKQMEAGRLRRCDPMKCAINLISLCLFPAHMKPVLVRIGRMDPSLPENAAEMARHNSEVFLRAFSLEPSPENQP